MPRMLGFCTHIPGHLFRVYVFTLKSVTVSFLIFCCPFNWLSFKIINGEEKKVALTTMGEGFLLIPQTPKSNGRGS